MANTAQARKRARQAIVTNKRKSGQRSKLRTHIKNIYKAIEAGNAETAQSAYQLAIPVIDGAVTKGLIHKNKAARQISRLGRHVRGMAA